MGKEDLQEKGKKMGRAVARKVTQGVLRTRDSQALSLWVFIGPRLNSTCG